MKQLLATILILCMGLLNAQISQGGQPRGITLADAGQIPSIVTEPVQKVILEEAPRYFIFGDEYEVNVNFFTQADSYQIDDGDISLLVIESPGALAIGLEMDDFYLSPGVEMFIYSEDGEIVAGAFTSENNNVENLFSTSMVKGSRIFIEVFEPDYVMELSRIHIRKIIHDYTDIMGYYPIDNMDRNNCNLNVACPEADPWWDQVNSVIRMSMGGGLCSASLINNVEQDLTPYVLTADHCISGSPGYYVFYFRYQASTCGGSSAPSSYTMNGSSLRASGDGPDFALLELNNDVPDSFNPFFNGWNRSSSSPNDPTGIHHPGGEIKKISFTEDYVTGTYYYWEFQFDVGRIYPGSSGSALFDPNHRTVGIASFMYTDYCYEWNCYCDQQYNVGYGRFDRAWDYGSGPSSRLRDWLDPNNSGVTYIDGTSDGFNSQVTVSSPDGGENWEMGTTHSISWSDNFDNQVSIKLYKNDSFVSTLTSSTPSDGNFNWTLSEALVPDNDYKIKINSVDDSGVFDFSDGYFTITGDLGEVIVSFGNINTSAQIIDIWLVNTINIAGFQFNVIDSPNLIDLEEANGGTTEENGFMISTNPDGTVLAFSLIGTTIPPGENLLTSLSYIVSEYDNTELCIENGIFSSIDGIGLPITYGDCVNVSLESFLPGDINFDGIVNILDIVMLVNEILEPGGFDDAQFSSADLNNDGILNILDIVSLVNMILT